MTKMIYAICVCVKLAQDIHQFACRQIDHDALHTVTVTSMIRVYPKRARPPKTHIIIY